MLKIILSIWLKYLNLLRVKPYFVYKIKKNDKHPYYYFQKGYASINIWCKLFVKILTPAYLHLKSPILSGIFYRIETAEYTYFKSDITCLLLPEKKFSFWFICELIFLKILIKLRTISVTLQNLYNDNFWDL